MASSKVVSTNPDLPRDSSISSSLSNFLLSDLPPNTMDDLLKSIYTPPTPLKDTKPSTTTLDDVWNHIVVGTSHRPSSDDAAAGGRDGMTLEDFLTKAGAVREEDVRGVMPSSLTPPHYPLPPPPPPPSSDASPSLQPSTPAAKGKRRVVEEPLDKATLQKQRRMIKNRESAARSRERKQAYTSELESLVQQLEEENARLLNEEAEREKQRLKQIQQYTEALRLKMKNKGNSS